jgi:hypothetical protein
MKLTPLNAEQQALCVQWMPLALAYMRRAFVKYGLAANMTDAEGTANDALVHAARVWESKRAPFPACLKWWVFAKARLYRTHGGLVVSRDRDQWEAPTIYRLDAKVTGHRVSTADESTWLDLLEDPNPERLDDVDARRAARAFEAEAIHALVGNYTTAKKAKSARLTFELWARKFSDNEVTFEELGSEYGFSRQAAEQRFKRVQAIFEEWAAAIRAEAA